MNNVKGVSCVEKSFIPSLRQYNLDQVRGYHLSLHSQTPLEIGCKGTNKRAKHQIYLDIFEREYLRAQLKGSAN